MKPDEAAKLLLQDRHPLTTFLLGLVRDRAVAEDLFQDVCVHAVRAAEPLADANHMLSWARHTAGRKVDGTARSSSIHEAPLSLNAESWYRMDVASRSEADKARSARKRPANSEIDLNMKPLQNDPTKTTISFMAAVILATVTPTQSADYAEPTALKLDQFSANIESRLQDRCVGFGYAIFQDSHFVRGGGGGAREKIEGNFGDHPFDENTQKDCHSMSKTITAAAMIKALQIRGIDLTARIYDYFPKRLQNDTPNGMSNGIANAMIKGITFEQMLAHKSGFAQSAKTWKELSDELKQGLDHKPGDDTVYANWNYGMCRLLIPYVLHTSWFRDVEKLATRKQLEATTAEIYTAFVRDRILTPAGATQNRTRPPQNPTTANFAYLYDFRDADAEGTMPDRRLDIGSGGWAMSAKTYGKFLTALFDGALVFTNVRLNGVSVNAVDTMKSKRLGMFTRTGTGGDRYYVHRGANSWPAGKNKRVGGKSIWMHFPKNNITAVIQINSDQNDIHAMGVERDQLLQEAYDEVYTDKTPSSLTHPINMFSSRTQDGWLASRGVTSTGLLGSTDFDVKGEDHWTHTRFFERAGKIFALHYHDHYTNSHGRMKVRQVKRDGTLGATVVESATWRKGWTHLEIFNKNVGNDTFLLLYDKNVGKIRTYRIDDTGKPVAPKITDTDAKAGFDIVKILRLSGHDHLFRHNSTTGETHVRALNANGSWGDVVYEKDWKKGFTTYEFYQTGNGKTYLLRYSPISGRANILRFSGTVAGLDTSTPVLDKIWSKDWGIMRFFRTEKGTFNFRYNAKTGTARIEAINSNGSFAGDYWENGPTWLQTRKAFSAFDPQRTGWTTVEFYSAKVSASSSPTLPIADETIPARASSDNDDSALSPTRPPSHPRLVEVKEAEIVTTLRNGAMTLQWQADRNVFYIVESSNDLQNWHPIDLIDGEDRMIGFHAADERDATGAPIKRKEAFYRVRTIESAPEDPKETVLPQ